METGLDGLQTRIVGTLERMCVVADGRPLLTHDRARRALQSLPLPKRLAPVTVNSLLANHAFDDLHCSIEVLTNNDKCPVFP